MNTKIIYVVVIFLLISILDACTPKEDKTNEQVNAAFGVIERILPEHAHRFILELIDHENGKDVFEIATINRNIVIRGSSGVAICSGFN